MPADPHEERSDSMKLRPHTFFLALLAALAAGSIARASETPKTEAKPGITPVHQLPQSAETRPVGPASLKTLPDSLAPDIHTAWRDRKSTRLNSSHLGISYAVFCLT